MASFFVLPHRLSQLRSSIRDQFSLMTKPRILMAFFIPALGFSATYAVFTYLVPILKGMGAPNRSISLILFGYGFISIFSNVPKLPATMQSVAFGLFFLCKQLF